MLRNTNLECLRPDEIIAERKKCSIIYVPLGPLEWHSYHLPIGTDPLNAQAVAKEVALRKGGVVFPTVFFGTERERPPEKLKAFGLKEDEYMVGMDFPGISLPSLYSKEEIFGLIIRQVLENLVKMEYKLIVLINGHGAKNHGDVLNRLCIEFSATTSSKVILTFALPKTGVAGHAEEVETSVMQYLHFDAVNLESLPEKDIPIEITSGIVDSKTFSGNPTEDRTLPTENDPRYRASVERGKNIFEMTVKGIIDSIEEIPIEGYK